MSDVDHDMTDTCNEKMRNEGTMKGAWVTWDEEEV
jgi:hypothetical protein